MEELCLALGFRVRVVDVNRPSPYLHSRKARVQSQLCQEVFSKQRTVSERCTAWDRGFSEMKEG